MKILAYDDNPDFGGHQIMASRGLKALAADPAIEVVCMIHPDNDPLADRLGGFKILAAPCTAQQLRSIAPDLVLCIQGDIGQSQQGVGAARKAGIECISYLAIPHTLQQMGAKLGALRDRANQHLLNQPSRYIVISESMKQILRDRGTTVPIDIVPNGIPAPPPAKITTHDSRTTLGLLGRVEFNQKQQDFIVDTFTNAPDAFGDCRLLMVGNGPDADKLTRLIARSSRRDDITLLPWQNDPESFYDKIDFLMIPSRFEGVPLVMLEALIRGIPVLGSRCDGMCDILPKAWLFEPKNGEAMAATFSAMKEEWKDDIDSVRERVASAASLDTFNAAFLRAVINSA